MEGHYGVALAYCRDVAGMDVKRGMSDSAAPSIPSRARISPTIHTPQ